MRGEILSFDTRTATGLISGEDGHRYTFSGVDFNGDMNAARAGRKVDFQIEDGNAVGIYPVAGTSGQVGEKSKLVAGLLGIFLGGLGIHKFYIGAKNAGIIMLVIWLAGWIILGLPTLIIGFIGFIEGILYIIKTDEEFYETYEVGKKPWF